jgi:hypothetical protein
VSSALKCYLQLSAGTHNIVFVNAAMACFVLSVICQHNRVVTNQPFLHLRNH